MEENTGNITTLSVSSTDSSSYTQEDEVSTVQEHVQDYGSQTIDLPVLDVSNHGSTVYTVTNSSNVDIIPTTQFYAPVTIHQHLNASNGFANGVQFGPKSIIENSKPAGESGPHSTPNTSKKKLYHVMISSLRYKLGILAIFIIFVIVVGVVVYLTVPTKGDSSEYDLGNSTEPEETPYDLGNDIHIFTRNRWGGLPILDGWQNRTMVHPVKLVIISHTASSQCDTVEGCSTRLQIIQGDHIERNKYLDIGYNFLIGGDGNVYQAYGWDIRNHLKNNSIQIAFIGNYVKDYLNDRQRMAVQLLVDHGIKLGKLDKNYFLIAHKQVQNTLSPGQHIVEKMKSWPHYSNRTFT